jgi:hypothetical protein
MNIPRTIHLVLALIVIFHARVTAQEQSPASTIFVVIPRDKDTREVLSNAVVKVSWEKGQGVTYTMADSGDGAVLIGFARGVHEIRVSAPGHETLFIKGINITTGTDEFLSSCGQMPVSSFNFPTVILGPKLSRTLPNQTVERTISWLSDSEYYWQTDVPPEPIGGISAIIQKLDFSKVQPTDDPYYKGYIRVGAYIDQSGSVLRVAFDQDLPKDVEATIQKAIMSTRFTPAQILGKTVRSHLTIPFDLQLKRSR